MTALLLTVGEALAVFLASDGQPLAAANQFQRIISGAEVNVAAGFIRLGHRARLVTRVGEDGLGDAIAAGLPALGIDARVGRSSRPTGVIIRDAAGPDGGRAVHLRAGAAAEELEPADIDQAWSPDVGLVFVTGITAVRSPSARAAVERLVRTARAAGALVVADPNLRTTLTTPAGCGAALAGIRGQVDIALGDALELSLLAGAAPADAPEALIGQGARLVVTKLGADGAVAFDGRDRFEVPTFASTVVDTVGAGDAMTAGLLVGLVEGLSTHDALVLGARTAAAVVAMLGDIGGIPHRTKLFEGAAP
jgi:2-dehydro-3-deoxygluconokinase